jgi:hypothetical protein
MSRKAYAIALLAAVGVASLGFQQPEPSGGDGNAPRPPLVIFELEKYFPGMTQLPDGALKAFFRDEEGRLASVRFSPDGRTLGKAEVECVKGVSETGVPNLATADGELHVLDAVLRRKAQRPGGPSGLAITRFIDLWHDRTVEGRSRWEGPKMIWDGYCGALMDWKQLKSGRILVPFGSWIAGRDVTHPTGSHVTTAVYSDDGGDTWALSPSELTSPCYQGYNGNNYGACEPSVIQLSDGRIWMLFRTQTGFMYESYSTDQGTTWSEAQASRFYSSTSPSDFDRLPDGRLVNIWNNYEMPPRVDGQFEYGGRDSLHAAISDDDGKTWRGFREIYRDPHRLSPERATGDRGTAYPLVYHTEAGAIVVVSGQGPGRRNVVVVNPAWLTRTEHGDDFSEGLDGWLTFKTVGPARGAGPQRKRVQGPELVAHPSKPGAKVLRLRRPDGNDGDGASWNFPLGWKGTLTLRLMLQPGSGRANIALGDRGFNPTNDNGEKYAQFNLPVGDDGQLGSGPKLESGRWHSLDLAWDLARRICDVRLDGRSVMQLKLNFETPNGVSYLRLRSLAAQPDLAGFLVESVAVKIDDPVAPPRSAAQNRAMFAKYRSTVSYESTADIKVDVM